MKTANTAQKRTLLFLIVLFTTFGVRTTSIYGNINHNCRQKSGRHTGESPAALFVVSTEVVRSDLPISYNPIPINMRTTEATGQNLSRQNLSKSIHQLVEDFFFENGDPGQLDQELWQITVAAFNSRDTEDLPPLERANLLSTYRAVSNLLFQLNTYSHG